MEPAWPPKPKIAPIWLVMKKVLVLDRGSQGEALGGEVTPPAGFF